MGPGASFLALALLAGDVAGGEAWLEVTRGPGAESCADAGSVARAVARELGREPVSAATASARRVRCAFEREAGVFRARITMAGSDPSLAAERTIHSRANDCGELASALALTLALALADPPQPARPPSRAARPDPTPSRRVRPHPPHPDAPDAPETPAAEPRVSQAVDAELPPGLRQFRPPPATPGAWGVSWGAVVSSGVWLELASGLELGARWRRGGFGIALEARGERAPRISRGAVIVQGWRLAGALVPCFAPGAVAGCLVLRAGRLAARSEGIPVSRSSAGVVAETGGRVAWQIGRGDLALAVYAEVTATLIRHRLLVDRRPLWAAPAAGFTLGVGALAWR